MIPLQHYFEYIVSHWPEVIAACKGIGYIGGAISVFVGLVAAIAKLLSRAKKIDSNLELVLTNHLPHIQDALDETSKKLGEHIIADEKFQADISTKLTNVTDRVENVKDFLVDLNSSFVRHLDNVNSEHREIRAMVTENKLDNDAKQAAKIPLQVEADVTIKKPLKLKKRSRSK